MHPTEHRWFHNQMEYTENIEIFRLWTQQNTVGFIIKWKTVSTIIFLSIRKQMKTYSCDRSFFLCTTKLIPMDTKAKLFPAKNYQPIETCHPSKNLRFKDWKYFLFHSYQRNMIVLTISCWLWNKWNAWKEFHCRYDYTSYTCIYSYLVHVYLSYKFANKGNNYFPWNAWYKFCD